MKKNYNRYQLKINGREVEIARWIPKKPASKSPILIAPGWTTTYSLIEHVLLELTNLERAIYVVIHPRVKNPESEQEGFDGYQWSETENLLGVIDNMDLKHIDLVAHSSGAIGATLAVQQKPKKFNSLTLFNPSGLHNENSLFKFSLRALHKVFDDSYQTLLFNRRTRGTFVAHYSQGAKYIFSHPIQTFKELAGISRAAVGAVLDEIRKKGVFVSIIAGEEDVIYPLDKLSKAAKPHVDLFKAVRGWHEAIIFNPGYYTKVLRDVLKQANSNRAKSSK